MTSAAYQAGCRAAMVKLGASLDVPIHRQETKYSCGAAAVRQVLSYLGFSAKEPALRKALDTTSDDGTTPESIVETLRSVPGTSVTAGTMTLQDLRDAVDNKQAVLIVMQAWSDAKHPDYTTDANGHYAVLRGYNKDQFTFSDPATNKPVTYHADELLKRWHDKGKTRRYVRYGIRVKKEG